MIGPRGDMNALPIYENNNMPYWSKHVGACMRAATDIIRCATCLRAAVGAESQNFHHRSAVREPEGKAVKG
jgi:hypothetical protein